MAIWISFLFVLNIILNIQAQVSENLKENPCHHQLTCRYCLLLPGCAWCPQEKFERGNPRCDVSHNLEQNGCRLTEIVNSKSLATILLDKPFTTSANLGDSVVQLRPQKLELKLRPNEAIRFNITFRQAEDYPVDLYYLMDMTFSMKEHKQKVSELVSNLAASMKNITKNFRLGFGSFIDKVVMPYADMVPERLENPCRDFACIPPYGFRNHLPLDNDIGKFREEVGKANLSGNLDNAEGGFDAIMQAMVCKNNINWSVLSRKIILFATDSIFHQAGDGKLGGVVKVNDGNCHLDSNGYYTESVHQDYPTLSQLNTKAMENKMHLIFAVPAERVPLYSMLSSHLEGAHTAQLSKDSSNIVQVIQDQYNKIRSEIKLTDNASPPVSIKYFSKCLGDSMEQVQSCDGLQIGNTVTFEVEVELTDCPEGPTTNGQVVTIYPIGLGEMVTLDLQFHCDCHCQDKGIANSEKCSGNGTYSCGICSCLPNHFGQQCECAGDDSKREEEVAQCRGDVNSSKVCSGRGDCICGLCDCYNAPTKSGYIYGKHCECDTYSCPLDNEGNVCGKRGRCCKGNCMCTEGWSGNSCECNEDTSLCVAPLDRNKGRMCSGRGRCSCGRCKCNKDERGNFGGDYCEDCSTCEGRCIEFRPCVECLAFQTGPLANPDDCNRNCSVLSQTITTVERLFEPTPDERPCIFTDEKGCSFEFFYRYDSVENIPHVSVRKEKVCPTQAEILYIVIGTVGGVFLLGLAILLIARLLIYLKDTRDYQRFQEEISKVKWETRETNPIYKKATSKFQNPMYNAEGK